MKTILVRLARDEFGITAIEYGLVTFLISIAIVGALTVTGFALGGLYVAIGNAVAAI